MPSFKRLLEQRARPLSRRTQLVVVVTTAIALFVATIWAWRSAGLAFGDISWIPLAGAFFIAAPLTLWLKVLEYDAAVRLIGARSPWRRSLEIATVSSAANLLPIPGSLLVTTRSLSEHGATYGSAIVAASIPGLAWLGFSGVIGGAAIVVAGGPIVGALVFAGGVAGTSVAGVMFRRNAPVDGRIALAVRISAIEVTWIALSGLRFWMVLAAIGVSATPAQVLALAVAGAMSVALGFFPGGLGAREALIALLSPIIHLPLAEGVLLGVVDRVVWLTFLSLVIGGIAASRAYSRRTRPDNRAQDPPEILDQRGV